ncbi:MAG: histidinol-phosphate transaminase [Actinobacteria bacterium]|nr:histidinol-phosphate transaminase [Actinomycetota bacterium]
MTDKFFKIARDEIMDLPVYSPGLDIDEVKKRYGVQEVIKLASNENPLGPSLKALEAVKTAAADMALYPDGSCGALREKLSRRLNVPPEYFIFGNGTDEVIDFIFYAFFNAGDRAVMGDPTFSSYILSGMMMGTEVVNVPLREYGHHIEEMVDAVDEKTKAVFIGTPHNPTGLICDVEDMQSLLDGIPETTLLVWDEAYAEYVDDPTYPDSVSYLSEYPNLIVLRTFSKIYGLAGLRIGYGMTSPTIVHLLERVRPPFNVNRLAQVGALAAIDDEAHVELSRKVNTEGKEYLNFELDRLGLKPVPTQANFILFRYDHLTDNLAVKLLQRGIIVRDGESLGYPGYIRITIGTRDQNMMVVQTLKEVL